MDARALTARWHALSPRSRWFLGMALACAIVLSFLASAITHQQRVPLFAQSLHPDQLSEVQERLAGWNVAFTPAADNVLVDAKSRNAMLLRLSLAGVPHRHVDGSGDLLGKLGALTPQAVIDAQTRNALSGDIELALRGIDGVEEATVIVAPAKEAYFADETARDASASVRLSLAPGAKLSAGAIGGIRSFVAAAVPGLDERRVTIVDDRGVALGSADGGDVNDLQRSLQTALDSALGAGAAIVRVRVDYDPRTIQSSDVKRVAIAAPIAATTQSERYDGAGKRYVKTEEQVDRGSETRESTASAPAGRIARISAAVFVDAQRAIDLYQVRTLAAATLGLDPHRGDVLDVAAIPFPHPAVARKDGWWLAYGAVVPLLPTLVLAVAAIVALRMAAPPFTMLVRSLLERSSAARGVAAISGAAPSAVRGALRGEPPHAAAAIISALPAATAAAVLDMYPEHERAAIVRRMQRPVSPLVPDPEQFVASA